jgi:hypothetical protein
MESMEYEVVRARKFEVVDEAGRVRAAIGSGPENSTGMQFYNDEREVKIEMSVDSDGSASLLLRDAGDNSRVALSSEEPFMTLTYSGGDGDSWAVGFTGIGGPGTNENARSQQPSLVISRDGRTRILVTLIEGIPLIAMYDEHGNEVWRQTGIPE